MGVGAGNSADGRLNALRNMLNQASYLINIGDYEVACGQLSAALKRCDDFVEGTAQNDLKQMISSLMSDSGCWVSFKPPGGIFRLTEHSAFELDAKM